MPLTREQDRLRARLRRQDLAYRKTQTLYAARHRQRQHVDNGDITMTDHPLPWWTKFRHDILNLIRRRSQRGDTNYWDRRCTFCGALLLRGESSDFCCNGGKRIVPPLPSLPPSLSALQSTFLHTKLSSYSRRLNNLFSFTAIGVSGSFVRFQSGIASVAITGRVYHRMLDVSSANHSIHWFLYDESERDNQGLTWDVPQQWINTVRRTLNTINPYVQKLSLFRSHETLSKTAVELSDFSSNGDFAAIIHASNTISVTPRNILIWRNSDNRPSFISIYSRHYEPLQYPLLFPHGSPGWGWPAEMLDARGNRREFTQIEWYRGRLLTDDRFNLFGRLTSEYICDMYCRVEEQRLQYIRTKGTSSNGDPALPCSFLGSRRWASEQSADGLALARRFGRPSFFVTMTCNPDWPEIRSRLQPGQSACDTPVTVARVFKQRLHDFMRILRQKFGSVVYMIKVIEFQKRGLPHAHLIIKVDPEIPLGKIDELITCRLPHNNVPLRNKIKKFMSHNRGHLTSETSRCNRGGKCIYGFPHPITTSTTIDDDNGRVQYQRLDSDEQWIAPHIPEFIDLMDCHIYWDVVFTVHVFMYLYKYLFKGPDHAWYQMQRQRKDDADEIDDYINGRYLSAPEAAWRILNFDITSKQPSVTCLPIHLPDDSIPQFSQGNRTSSTASDLIRYFFRPTSSQFNNILYAEYYQQYVRYPYKEGDTLQSNEFLEQSIPMIPTRYKIRHRLRSETVARLRLLSPTVGEAFYLRALLAHRPARNFDDLKTVNGITFETFHEAAIEFGIFRHVDEGFYALEEAVSMYCTPSQLRFLFSRIVLEGYPARPLWDTFCMNLSHDYRINFHSDEFGLDMSLHDISFFLCESHRSLLDFGLPSPSIAMLSDHADEILAEHTFSHRSSQTLQQQVALNISLMTSEQRHTYDILLQYIYHPSYMECPKFVEGKPGRGKTFLMNTIASTLRSESKIVLIVATSAIAALMYERGQTAHSMFKIPVNDNNINIESSIKPNSDRANLIKQTALIIWDELPLANRAVLESVNDVCQRLRKNFLPFGGIPFIGLGDFRQVAPVIKGQGISSTLNASVKSSDIWKRFTVLRLQTPIRSAHDSDFTHAIDIIGEDYSNSSVTLPIVQKIHSVQDAVDFLYPTNLLAHDISVSTVSFLSPLNIDVDEFNEHILQMVPGQLSTSYVFFVHSTFKPNKGSYYSADVVKENNETFLQHTQGSPDYLSMLTAPGTPPHALNLKVGCVCTIMRNMSIQKGLVKNAKVIVHNLGDRLIEVRVIQRSSGELGNIECLPRIRFDFTPPNVTWTVQRLQFPLRLAYASTFHSCIGCTLDKVVLDLRHDVFSHGQLYTACSRVRRREDIRILLDEHNDTESIKNVVYKQLLL